MNQYPNLADMENQNNLNQPFFDGNQPPHRGMNYPAPPPNPGMNYHAPPPNPGMNFPPHPNMNYHAPPSNPGINFPSNPGMNYHAPPPNPGFNTPVPPPPQSNNIIIIKDSNNQQLPQRIVLEAPVYASHNLPSFSVRVSCRNCQSINNTIVKEESSVGIAVAIILCLFFGVGLIFPWFFLCCLIPSYNSSRRIKHSCSRCGLYVGEYQYS